MDLIEKPNAFQANLEVLKEFDEKVEAFSSYPITLRWEEMAFLLSLLNQLRLRSTR